MFHFFGQKGGPGDKKKKGKKKESNDHDEGMKLLGNTNNLLLGTGGLMYGTGEAIVASSYMELVQKVSAHTGFSKVDVGRALSGVKGALKKGGKVTFVLGTVISTIDGVDKLRNGDNIGAAKAGLDITMGVVGTAGPIGATIGGVYFIIDVSIGWDNAIQSYITVEKNKAFMRSKNIMNFSDFKN